MTHFPGERIVYRDDETGALIHATVLEVAPLGTVGWLEVADDGVEDDTPWISEELIEEAKENT